MEDSAMPFARTWFLGDAVTVVVEAQELASTVTGYVLKADNDGVRLLSTAPLAASPTCAARSSDPAPV